MNERLLLGRSIETGSWVHKLDPRSKLVGMLLYSAAILLSRSWPAIALIAAISVAVAASTRIPLKYYVLAAKPLRYLMLFILIVQLLTVKEGAVLVTIGSFSLYEEGLRLGAFAAIRTFLLVAFTALLTFTTTPARLNQGLEGILSPLRFIGLSPARFTLMISLALRFIPTILDEAEIVLKAQASRGADLSELPLKEKGRMLVTLLVPVIAGAFRRAQDLVYSMEARGFRMDAPRSRYHRLKWGRADSFFIAIFILAGLAAAIL
ncbi:energy-coupling factor transporter transmembrane protein EcfT [Paenibacillus sp. 7124]|uniref:Energy-coupling factor transporter transmembrane protein EcfT n=1 Tax=Paenibacillus apii TaxID=1850370 RepID=A0A6M1PQX5_9BACL|nr:energy-coupling factor transporter transmembrane component T [Paenibacillus apii]NGM84422.1 energy-coupling factor transporter transmembrane protein EcfT [Paenibacillus apii]NJJ38372.1 energy-coupling factor transporter transmembrane protein EcfT [Paenibacillus apii]